MGTNCLCVSGIYFIIKTISIPFLQYIRLSWSWVTVKDFKKNSPGNFGLTKRLNMGRIRPARFILV